LTIPANAAAEDRHESQVRATDQGPDSQNADADLQSAADLANAEYRLAARDLDRPGHSGAYFPMYDLAIAEQIETSKRQVRMVIVERFYNSLGESF